MKPRYEIRVVELQAPGRTVAVWPPGGVAERDFVAAVVASVRAKGVG